MGAEADGGGRTPEEWEAREERLFQLSEELQASLEAGAMHEDSVWAVRFDLEEEEVARVRRGLQLLFFDDEEQGFPEVPGAIEELAPPALPEDYELRGELGRGGMGVVYRVHQVSLNRELALKVLRPGEMQARRAIDRFKREARSLARLRHPHIASLHEVGECDGRVYFTMDLIEGHSLATVLKEGAVTPSRASRWARQLASALQYVHSHGLVHRDIKPANILIDGEDNACLVDFGLARDVEVSSDLTMSGHFLGTPAYMAPEQVQGQQEAVGESADIYGLGAVLYECLTGQRAFDGKTLVQVIHAVSEGEFLAPSEVDGKIPTGLELVCLKAMSREPHDRYATARALLEDLERFEAGRMVLASPPSTLHRARDFWQRNLPSMRVAMITVVVMFVVFGLLLTGPLGGLRFRGDLLEEAQELARAGQTELALQMFARDFPERPSGSALEGLGLTYCDVLLAQIEAANWAGDRAEQGRLQQVATDLVDVAQERIRKERLGLDEALLALEVEWAFRALRLAALARDLELLEDRNRQLDTARWKYDGVSATERPDGQAWDESILPEELFARAFLPDLLDAQRDDHDQAVDLWADALGPSGGLYWVRRNSAVLFDRFKDDLPRILVALLSIPSSHSRAPEVLERASLSNAEANLWREAVGHCDPRTLRVEVAEALDLRARSGEDAWALRHFARAIRELPVLEAQGEDLDGLIRLLRPEPVLGVSDLERRARYLAGLLVQDPNLPRKELIQWARATTGSGLPKAIRVKNGEDLTAEEFGEALISHCAGSSEAGDAQDVLAKFDHALRSSTRRILHEQLKGFVPSGQVPPIWAGTETSRLATRWHELLDPDFDSRIYRAELAVVRFDLGAREPVLRHRETLEWRAGELWEQTIPVPGAVGVDAPGTGLLATMGIGQEPDIGHLSLRGRLAWGPGGMRLEETGSPEVRGLSAWSCDVRGPVGRKQEGQVWTAAHLTFRRDREEPVLADEFVFLRLVSEDSEAGGPDPVGLNGVGFAPRSALDWWQASGLELRHPVHKWAMVRGPAAREKAVVGSTFEQLPGDVQRTLFLAALDHGEELSEGEQSRFRRLEEAAGKLRMKSNILWGLVGVFGFLVLGGVLGGIYQAMRAGERNKRKAAIEAASQEEREAMAPSLLTTTLMWVWWPVQIPFDWNWGRMALFSLLAWNACRFSRSRWNWVPSTAGAVAAVIYIVQSHLGTVTLVSPRYFALPFAIFVVGLFSLPLVFDHYWSWHPDPAKGQRLRKIANNIFFAGFVVPFSLLSILDNEWSSVVARSWQFGGWEAMALSFVAFFGAEVWVICLLRATSKRSGEIMKRAMERRRAIQRARKAAGESGNAS